MRHYLAIAAAVIITSIFGTAPALADDALPQLPGIKITACRDHDHDQERKDSELSAQGLKAVSAHDMDTLKQLSPDLDAALARAPDTPIQAEQCGKTINLYTDDMMRMLIVSAIISKLPDFKDSSVVQFQALPYADLAFVVGWTHYENKEFEAAHTTYVKGLLNDPESVVLTSEDSMVLANLHRDEEALALVDTFIAGHPDLEKLDMALLLRKRGYILVEMGKLTQAKAAYKQSLKLDPGSEIAKGELRYIAEQTQR